MSGGGGALRLVLDTNVVLDCVVFDDPAARALVARLDARDAVALTRGDCIDELVRVLGYPQFALDAAARARAYERFAAWTEPAEMRRGELLPLPRCRDRDDQKFLELARDGAAAYLVTKDKALLALARRVRASFAIVHPHELARRLATVSASA